MGDFHPVVITVGIYAGGPKPIPQQAVKDPNSSQSEITEACLRSMGLAIPPSRTQQLKWAYKACTFWSDFVVVASAKNDVVLGSADYERIREADIPSAFPSQLEKKSLESKKEHDQNIKENKARQREEKNAEHKKKLAAMRPTSGGN